MADAEEMKQKRKKAMQGKTSDKGKKVLESLQKQFGPKKSIIDALFNKTRGK